MSEAEMKRRADSFIKEQQDIIFAGTNPERRAEIEQISNEAIAVYRKIFIGANQ